MARAVATVGARTERGPVGAARPGAATAPAPVRSGCWWGRYCVAGGATDSATGQGRAGDLGPAAHHVGLEPDEIDACLACHDKLTTQRRAHRRRIIAAEHGVDPCVLQRTQWEEAAVGALE